jgi:hypothetical protein
MGSFSRNSRNRPDQRQGRAPLAPRLGAQHSISLRLIIVRGNWQQRLDHPVIWNPASLFSLADLKIGRRHRARWRVRTAFAVGIHDAKIVLGMLVQVFSGNPIAAGSRLACQRDVPLEYLIRIATDLDVRTVAVESLDPIRQPRAIMMMIIPVAASARSFVWSRSHNTFLIFG